MRETTALRKATLSRKELLWKLRDWTEERQYAHHGNALILGDG